MLASEDVSVDQVNLDNTTLWSSLTMRAPAGLTALTCHSSNAAGNTSQKLPVPHLDIQPNLTGLTSGSQRDPTAQPAVRLISHYKVFQNIVTCDIKRGTVYPDDDVDG